MNINNTPPSPIQQEPLVNVKKQRESNLELYRIICMLLIVAHHYVVNSGLTSADGPLASDFTSYKSMFMALFGAWGKTGINCFVLITGYFMCASNITLRKFLKLMTQFYFYKWLIAFVFIISGYEHLSLIRLVKLVIPFWSFSTGFTSCFIAFWLTIPFLSILVRNLNKRQHQLFLLLSLGIYTVFGSIPSFEITLNYITWFCVLFLISSYIRMYPHPLFEKCKIWGWMTLLSVVLACISILFLRVYFGERVGLGYNFVQDCNKFFAVIVSICSFLWFKNMNIRYNRTINTLGAGTFGVFLIHANSDTMRTWLWKDTIDSLGHYYAMPIGLLAVYSIGVVLAIFFICNLIDQLRMATFEKWFFNWYDDTFATKANMWIDKLMK